MGRAMGGWCERVSWFRDGVGNFFYNGDIRNSKTVLTGEAVDKSVDKSVDNFSMSRCGIYNNMYKHRVFIQVIR